MDELVRLTRGCRIPVTCVDDLTAQLAAVLAIAPPHTLVVGMSAARLHGFRLPETTRPITLATCTPGRAPSAMTRPRRTELRAHRRSIEPDDQAVAHGIPVTSVARTWRDIAVDLSLPDLVAAGDGVLQSGVDTCELAEVTERLRGRRGARRALTALSMVNSRSRSRPESHLRVALVEAGLPQFDVNRAVLDDVGQWLAEPDLSLRPARIALEYQGADHAELARMRRDITRLADLRRAGWAVLLYGPAEVFGRPWQIAPEIRQLICARAPQLLRARYAPRAALTRRVGS